MRSRRTGRSSANLSGLARIGNLEVEPGVPKLLAAAPILRDWQGLQPAGRELHRLVHQGSVSPTSSASPSQLVSVAIWLIRRSTSSVPTALAFRAGEDRNICALAVNVGGFRTATPWGLAGIKTWRTSTMPLFDTRSASAPGLAGIEAPTPTTGSSRTARQRQPFGTGEDRNCDRADTGDSSGLAASVLSFHTERGGAKLEHGKELNIIEQRVTALNGSQRHWTTWGVWVSTGGSPLWSILAARL